MGPIIEKVVVAYLAKKLPILWNRTHFCEEDVMNLITLFFPVIARTRFFRRCSCAQHFL